jgi:transposase
VVAGHGAALWKDLPRRFSLYHTCHRRFQHWVRTGVLRQVSEALSQDLYERSGIKLAERFIDGSFSPAKKGGAEVGKTKRGTGTKLVAVADSQGVPIAAYLASASLREVTLAQAPLDERFVVEPPQRLVGDKAGACPERSRRNSDRPDQALLQEGIELIAPHWPNRYQLTQHRRPLRRYRQRWKVERLFAWFHNFRRLMVRRERYPQNFLGFIHLACILILFGRYL